MGSLVTTAFPFPSDNLLDFISNICLQVSYLWMKLTCPIIKPIESTSGVPLTVKQFCGQKSILAQAFPNPVEGLLPTVSTYSCYSQQLIAFPKPSIIILFIFIFLRSIYFKVKPIESRRSKQHYAFRS